MSSVLVTGTSSGIGLATVLAVARAGHTVYATMRNLAKAGDLRAAVNAEKLPVTIHQLDVDSDGSVAAAVTAIRTAGGSIDVLVNNAGVERHGAVEELPMEDFRACMETNYFGAVRCIRAVLPEMRERGSGVIVNVTSVAGRSASSPLGAYSASKHALEALSEALAQEGKPFGIRVAIVEPGIIDTPMARAISDLPPSRYPQGRRVAKLFAATLASERPPSLVGDRILEIIESGTWQLRHPVGPGAAELIAMRAGAADEDHIAWGALDDDAWYESVRHHFGLDLRAFDQSAGA